MFMIFPFNLNNPQRYKPNSIDEKINSKIMIIHNKILGVGTVVQQAKLLLEQPLLISERLPIQLPVMQSWEATGDSSRG